MKTVKQILFDNLKLVKTGKEAVEFIEHLKSFLDFICDEWTLSTDNPLLSESKDNEVNFSHLVTFHGAVKDSLIRKGLDFQVIIQTRHRTPTEDWSALFVHRGAGVNREEADTTQE